MSSIFSRIIAGEIPCYKVAETKNCFAFLDVKPLTKGHVLVVPKTEIDYSESFFKRIKTIICRLDCKWQNVQSN